MLNNKITKMMEELNTYETLTVNNITICKWDSNEYSIKEDSNNAVTMTESQIKMFIAEQLSFAE